MKKTKNKKKKKGSNITGFILAGIFLLGLAIMLYPTVANYVNQRSQTRAVELYEETVAAMSQEEIDALIAEAQEYNRKLANLAFPLAQADQIPGYENILNVNGNGIMGYISINRIRVELPIYHGTSDDVLAVAAGHLKGTSLPVGGTNTHAVISAHRGLPSARLFTDLPMLVPGDIFKITILDKTYTYVVDQIVTILPNELNDLAIDPTQDYVTLMTCTPYGINTHRLLVRGVRTSNDQSKYVANDATEVDPLVIAVVLSVPILILLMLLMFIRTRQQIAAEKRAAERVKEGNLFRM